MLKGIVSYNITIGIIAGTTLIFGVVYTLRAYQLSMYGPLTKNNFEDLHWSELVVLAIIVLAIALLGVYPALISDFVNPSIEQLLQTISTPLGK